MQPFWLWYSPPLWVEKPDSLTDLAASLISSQMCSLGAHEGHPYHMPCCPACGLSGMWSGPFWAPRNSPLPLLKSPETRHEGLRVMNRFRESGLRFTPLQRPLNYRPHRLTPAPSAHTEIKPFPLATLETGLSLLPP